MFPLIVVLSLLVHLETLELLSRAHFGSVATTMRKTLHSLGRTAAEIRDDNGTVLDSAVGIPAIHEMRNRHGMAHRPVVDDAEESELVRLRTENAELRAKLSQV